MSRPTMPMDHEPESSEADGIVHLMAIERYAFRRVDKEHLNGCDGYFRHPAPFRA
jgi:hypothetical protein